MKTLSSLIVGVALAGCGAMLHAQPLQAVNGVLTGPNGMTLYTFDRDTAGSGKSACNGPCAVTWPPLSASAAPAASDYSLVVRDDGTQQLAYKGKPLYYWAKDTKPGDMLGDGINQVWHAAKP